MNQVAKLTASAVAIPPRLPDVPPVAADFVRDAEAYAERRMAFAAACRDEREEMFVGLAPRPPALRPDQRNEVARGLAYLEAECRPPSATMLGAWLAPINAAVRNPQSREDLAVRVAAMVDLLGDLPAGAFTLEARRAMRCEFFPSAAEVRKAVEPHARRLVARVEALRRMVDPQPAGDDRDAPREEVTPEQRAAMAAQARALVAELRGGGTSEGVKPGGKALPLSDGAMLAHYRRLASEGNAAAATRVAAIEARLGLDA